MYDEDLKELLEEMEKKQLYKNTLNNAYLPATILCTVGTSLFFPNLSRLNPEIQYQDEPKDSDPIGKAEKRALERYDLWIERNRLKHILCCLKQFYEEKSWIQLAENLVLLPPELRLCGAEINSIKAMIRKGVLSDQRERLMLLVSDTKDGESIGSILSAYFTHPKCRIRFKQCECLIVGGLQDERPLIFQKEGLTNLVRLLGEQLRKWGGESIAINATGGYKAQIALAVALGQAVHCPVFYKHERFDQIIRFPEVPFSLDLSLIEKHLKVWEALAESGASFEEKEMDRLLSGDPSLKPSLYHMMERIEEEGKTAFSLSALGRVYWEAYLTLNPSPEKKRIFQLPEYQEINEQYFTKGRYIEALPRFQKLYEQLHSGLPSACKAILLNRIANSASDAVLTQSIDDSSLVNTFWEFLGKYLKIVPEALQEDERFRKGVDEPKKRLKEALELLIRFDQKRLKEKAMYWVKRFSEIDATGWGFDLALGVLMDKISDERTQFTRQDHIANTRALAEVYVEVSKPVSQTYRYARSMAMNILSDLAYFEGGEKGEEEALNWATQCLELNPDDLFAKTRKKYIEERQTVEKQIRRFKHDTGNTIAGMEATLKLSLRLPEASQDPLRRYLKIIQTELKQLYGAHRLIHDQQPSFKSIDVEQAIKDLILPHEKHSAHFSLTTSGPAQKWSTDPDYFRLAVYNLIRNSLEAFERRRIPLEQRQVSISLLLNKYALIMEDNAGGVDLMLKDRIFSPYVSSKGIKKETGLGLSNARKAIEKLGGSIDFPDNQPENGARFEIHLSQKESGYGNK